MHLSVDNFVGNLLETLLCCMWIDKQIIVFFLIFWLTCMQNALAPISAHTYLSLTHRTQLPQLLVHHLPSIPGKILHFCHWFRWMNMYLNHQPSFWWEVTAMMLQQEKESQGLSQILSRRSNAFKRTTTASTQGSNLTQETPTTFN